jgi:hypothetical protein
MIGMRTLSFSDTACTVCPFYVLLCDLNSLSLGWLFWIGQSDSNGTTLLTTALWCPHTTSQVGIHGHIVNLKHLVRYMHLIAVGQLLRLKRYRSKSQFTFLNFQCQGLVSLTHGALLKGNKFWCRLRYDICLLG